MNKTKKILSIALIILLLLGRSGSFIVYAEEAVPAGEAQPAAEATTTTHEEDKPDKEKKADKPDEGSGVNEAQPAAEAVPAGEATAPQETNQTSPEQTVNQLATESEGEHAGTTSDGNTDGAKVETGDANNTGAVYTLANNNLAGIGGGNGNGSGVGIANTGNGAGSNNDGSATVINNNDTNQGNSAVVVNNVTQESITGDNSASKNIGDSSITTGDANVSATVITAANTNVAGMTVSEFNIVDDHNGDYVLDFNAGCIAGCGSGPLAIVNANNGADSNNTGEINNTTNNNTDQVNDGTVINDVNLDADTGHNETSKNTGGDSSITTGDANVAANLMTFLNNNIAGNVVFGVVNIFGDLVGDIIMPDNVFDSFACATCGGSTSVANTANGANSDNNATVNDTTNNNIFQNNDATIENNVYLEAETGENSASRNNQGDVNIQTGQTELDASVLNIANLNLIGTDMWLVIVNEAGNWIGKLFGAPNGENYAGSEGTELAIGENGQINVVNAGNGANSNNNGTVNNTTNNNLNQSNTGNVVNNVNLSANTGGNTADKNNGNVDITTGDAKAIANIVNFVNNNIAGGRLLVTVVNVFGSWMGDFMTPGSHKNQQAVATSQSENSNTQNNNNGSSNSQTAVAGVFAENNKTNQTTSVQTSNTGFKQGSSIKVKVAGIKIENPLNKVPVVSNDAKTSGVKLNLAWVLLFIPFAAALIVLRKIYIRKISAPKI